MVTPLQNRAEFFSGIKSSIESLNFVSNVDQQEIPTQLNRIHKDLCLMCESLSSPQDLSNAQILVNLFSEKVKKAHNPLEKEYDCQSLSTSIAKTIFQIPDEVLSDIFFKLPLSGQLEMRQGCRYIQGLIDGSPLLQPEICFQQLRKLHTHHKLGIAMNELFYAFHNNQLAIQIHTDSALVCLIDNMGSIIPWLNHLIIKQCSPRSLDLLFSRIVSTNHLETLTLLSCMLSSENASHLQSLLNPKDPATIPLTCYFCEVKPVEDFQLSEDLTRPSDKVIFFKPEDSDKYAIERFSAPLKEVKSIQNFEIAVLNDNIPPEDVLAEFDKLSPRNQTTIAASLWYAALFNPETANPSTDVIKERVRKYISQFPHNPAIACAVDSAMN